MTRVVTGVFHDKERVTDAVEGLLEKDVPRDEISVVLKGTPDEESREVPVEKESGATKGAVVGGSVGAALGVLGIPLVVASAVTPGLNIFVAGPIIGGMAAVGGVTGAAIGAPAGLATWDGLKDVPEEELERGAAMVAVHSDELAGTAREVFQRTGADHIAEGDGSGNGGGPPGT